MITRVAWSVVASALALASVRTCTRQGTGPGDGPTPPTDARPPAPTTLEPAVLALPPAVRIPASELAPWPEASPQRRALSALIQARQRLQDDKGQEALVLTEDAQAAADLAPGLWAEVRGQALHQAGRLEEALQLWSSAPTTGRTWGAVVRAATRALLEAGRVDEALQWSTRDPSQPTGADLVLLRARAHLRKATTGDREQATALLWDAWARGGAQVHAAALAELQRLVGPNAHVRPRGEERVARATALAQRIDYDAVIELLSGKDIDFAALSDPAACEGPFELGRALNKRRRYSESLPWLAEARDRCPATEIGVRAGYLHAQGLARTGRVEESVAAFIAQSERRKDHSYADDCLLQAATLELGDDRAASAQGLLERALREFPDGDMAGDARWNLAWTAIIDGRPRDSLAHLEALGAGDLRGPEREERLRARYWHMIALDRVGDPLGAEDGWSALAEEATLHWYGVLSWQRLRERDPERAFALADAVGTSLRGLRAAAREPEHFEPERNFWEDPGVVEALHLLRAGAGDLAVPLLREALGPKPEERWSEGTLLTVAHLAEQAGDWSTMQDMGRRALSRHWPGLDPKAQPLLAHAWPRAFADEIDAGAHGMDWSPLLLQALAREESTFNPEIVSWAGAIGLTQLMPDTARMTARRHGLGKADAGSLKDPRTNARIGGAYLGDVLARWGGHVPLGVSSYNAGPGAVSRWIRERPELELDAWVESIPYDQTRHYVVRVVSSFQAYHALFGEGPPFVRFPIGPVEAAVAGAKDDPTLP